MRDRTGLTDAFDLAIDFARDAAANAGDSPAIMSALKEQLGLELRPATGPVSVPPPD